MRRTLVVLHAIILATAAARPAGSAEVALTIQNALAVDRAAEPVTCGVPLPRGFAASAGGLGLVGPRGEAVPLQLQVTGAYGDGSPGWVLLDFAADVPAGGEAVYRLRPGAKRPDPAAALTCRLDDGVATVSTGSATFRIDTRRFRLFDSVTVGGVEVLGDATRPRGLVLESPGGATIGSEAARTTAEIEDAGPVRALLCVRGELQRKDPALRARFVCRMAFQAGSSAVRVRLTLHNPAAHQHPGNIWDLGSGGSLFLEDASLVLPLGDAAAEARVAGLPGTTAKGRVTLYQDSSGGERWSSANHVDKDLKVPVSFRGYRVLRGAGVAAEGNRIDGWIHARGGRGGVAVAVREFWQSFPKALSLEDGSLRIGLWPREFAGAHEILGGEQKTHEMLFVFHGADASPDAADAEADRRIAAFHAPLHALPDAAAVLATRAFWPSAPLDRERFAALEATCDIAVHPRGGSPDTIETRREAIDEYGWRHFGDTFADNEDAPEAMVRDFPDHHPDGRPISHFVNEYDLIYAAMLHGIRRGDPAWMRFADACARHHADICVNHTDEDAPAYSHGPFMHTTHETAAYRSTLRAYPIEAKRYGLRYGQGGGPNAGHAYVACLAQHWLLTGDRTSLEAFLEVAGWAADSPWFAKGMMGDQRGYGNLLLTLVDAYRLTGDRKYHDRAATLVRWIEEPFAGLGGNLFAKAAGRFLDMKLDRDEDDVDSRYVCDLLMRFGEHYLALPRGEWEGSLEMRCFHAEVLCTCYLHAPPDHPRRDEFRRAGTRILDEALDRFPGRYVPTKTWAMCFGNVGAYLKARRP